MFQTEVKLTIGITPELSIILSGFLGYLSSNKAITEKQPEITESAEKEKESTGRQSHKSKADKSPVVTESVTPLETQTEEKDISTEPSGKESTPEPPTELSETNVSKEELVAACVMINSAEKALGNDDITNYYSAFLREHGIASKLSQDKKNTLYATMLEMCKTKKDLCNKIKDLSGTEPSELKTSFLKHLNNL